MNIETKTSLVGFLLALSTLTVADQVQANSQIGAIASVSETIEGRLQRLTNLMKNTADQIATDHNLPTPVSKLAAWGNGGGRGWADGSGRGWVNANRGGWGDGRGGGWVNGNAWRNGWADGGGFLNSR